MTADDQAFVTVEFCYGPQAKHGIQQSDGVLAPALPHISPVTPLESDTNFTEEKTEAQSSFTAPATCLPFTRDGWRTERRKACENRKA